MRKFINIAEGLFGGHEDDDDFEIENLGPTGTMQLFHASPSEITKFRPFTHFGTVEAAKQRAKDQGFRPVMHEIEYRVEKSLWINDGGTGNHTVEGIMEYLETILELDFDDVSSAGNDPNRSAKLLMKYGYDALVYHNGWEDKGSISVVIIDPSKIKIIDVTNS